MARRLLVHMGLAVALAPVSCFAVDGQILINQSTVLAAGGFPYTISQPGSYKLSGNLDVPSGTSGILITASNVTLDLNGFSITTPIQAFGQTVTGVGSLSGTPSAITIRNGAIRGFSAPINAVKNNFWTLQDLVLDWGLANSFFGVDFGAFTLIRHVSAPIVGIAVSCPSIVTESVFEVIGIDPLNPGNRQCTFANNATLF